MKIMSTMAGLCKRRISVVRLDFYRSDDLLLIHERPASWKRGLPTLVLGSFSLLFFWGAAGVIIYSTRDDPLCCYSLSDCEPFENNITRKEAWRQ